MNAGDALVVHRVAVAWRAAYKAIVCGIDFKARSGSVTILCGSNGSGKSTLLCALSGLTDPVVIAGTIAWQRSTGTMTWDKDCARAQAMLLRQTAPFVATDRVSSYFDLFADTPGFSRSVLEDTVQRFALSQVLDVPLGRLSGGQWRRVQCAAHFATRGSVRLLDEPESGLDRRGFVELVGQVRQARQRGEIIIIATHSRALLESVADDVCYLDEGTCTWNSRAGLFLRYGPRLV